MKHTYVKCSACIHQFENNSDPAFWASHPCPQCKNTRQVIDPKEILCNLCGESMCPLGTMNEQYPHGLHKATVVGGYDSYHLFDMTGYTFSFCEKCLRTLFIQCKIKPHVTDTDVNGNFQYLNSAQYPLNQRNWDEDQKRYEFLIWKDNGGHHQAYLNRKCNVEKDCPNDAEYTILISDDFTEECCCEQHKDYCKYVVNSKLTKFIPNVLKPFL